MDETRYLIALAVVVLTPPAVAAWLVVHPWIALWRRIGTRTCYGLLALYYAAATTALFMVRGPLLDVVFRFDVRLATAGVLLLGAATYLRWTLRRLLTPAIMFGYPEISPQKEDRLLTQGIYARMRHPRYVEAFLGLAGLALLTNHAAVWGVTLIYVPVAWVIVVLEERELMQRFGARYAAYRDDVPRFVPAWKRSGRAAERDPS